MSVEASGMEAETYAVQMSGNIAVSIDDGCVSAQLDDFADNHDIAADIVVQILAVDAGGGRVLHNGGQRVSLAI